MRYSGLFPILNETYYRYLGTLRGLYHDGISGLIVQITLFVVVNGIKFTSDRLDEIDERLDLLDHKLNELMSLVNQTVKPNCEKMNEHITFVESIYENVKNPLGFSVNLSICILIIKPYSLDN